MSAAQLDSAKLDNPKPRANGDVEAACPACREMGGDKAGNHLFVKADGRFGCVSHPDDTDHRKRIFALIGTKSNETPRTTTPRTQPTRTWPTAERAAKACEPSGYTLAKCWTYADNGREVLAVARFENASGKTFRQFRPIGDGWTIGAPTGKLPLLGKDQLPTSGPVVVVEGEKCFDAAQAIGLPVVCAAGGCGGENGLATHRWPGGVDSPRQRRAGREIRPSGQNDSAQAESGNNDSTCPLAGTARRRRYRRIGLLTIAEANPMRNCATRWRTSPPRQSRLQRHSARRARRPPPRNQPGERQARRATQCPQPYRNGTIFHARNADGWRGCHRSPLPRPMVCLQPRRRVGRCHGWRNAQAADDLATVQGRSVCPTRYRVMPATSW